ncbi:MAG: hypothetical protein O3A96_15355 [Proteobacteria bacterium]|nr:hypothetical protein [Pseudomonadota bacterium]
MEPRCEQMAKPRSKRLALVWALVAAGITVFVVANAHLAYVAVSSQPDCVAHLKAPSSDANTFRAAKSAC